jgi:uncharacterized membrane protein YfbV (UPF0208 family)
MYKKLYKNRYTIFFCTQLAILFGSMVVHTTIFTEKVVPILFLINIASGILMIIHKKVLAWFYTALFVLSLAFFGMDIINESGIGPNLTKRFFIYFIFYVSVTYGIIHQVWKSKKVNTKVIIGLISGYISIGFIAFFLFSTLEIYDSNSFVGQLLTQDLHLAEKLDALLYFSYITILTIGYGDIIPATPLAQKAVVLVGLVGQFYILIVTAVVIEKYIRHSRKE